MGPIDILGAGGIGCAVGYALLEAGRPIRFIEKDPAKLRWGNRHGVCVDQRPPLKVPFVGFDDWSPPPESTVLLCTKCYDNAEILPRIAGAKVVPIQNGFDPALLRMSRGWEGIASFVSECIPGRTHARITRRGSLHVGQHGPGNDSSALRSLRNTRLFRYREVPNILPFKYTKLMYNAAISPLAAAAGLDNGSLLRVPKARKLFFALLGENHSILRQAGIPLERIGPFHPDTVRRILARPWVARSMACFFYYTLRGTYCSMSPDLPKGRTEIDFYNLHLIELAGAFPCPLNRRVYALIRRMEREQIKPSLTMLDELGRVDDWGRCPAY